MIANLGPIALLAAFIAAGDQAEGPAYHDMFGAISPEGARIAFTSDRFGDPEIYVAARDGSALQRLTAVPGRDAHPAWSPDGRLLAFQSPRDGGDVRIYLMNADGSDQRLLVRTRGFCGVPAWSPDSLHIAFQCSPATSGPGRPETPWRLFVVRANGRGLRQVSFGPGNDQVPAWSPEGARLLFYSDRTGTDQLYELILGSGLVVAVTSGADTHRAATYSRDGRTIAMMKGPPNGRADVHLLDRASGTMRRLTRTGPQFGAPQISPAEPMVLFQAPTERGTRLHFVPVEGGEPVRFEPR